MTELTLDSDLSNYSESELKKLYEEYTDLSNVYTAYEQAVKLTLNSIYGAFGNQWFEFFNIDIAEAITKQAKRSILLTEEVLNKYFLEFWHKDKQLHNDLGITNVKPIKDVVSVYIDTDSNYLTFQEVYRSFEWKEDVEPLDMTDFILKVTECRIANYLDNCLIKYTGDLHADNYLNFELEAISHQGIWLAKKNYILDLGWDDKIGKRDSLSKIKVTGFDTVKSSTPAFARDALKKLINLILSMEKHDVSIIAKEVAEIKKKFKLQKVEDVCINKKANNVRKYIVNDSSALEVALKCPPQVKGVGYHNFLLNQNPKYKTKYGLVGEGEKVKFYYTTELEPGCFSFAAGSYPYEIAPPMDYDTQFEKVIIDPLNRILTVMKLPTLSKAVMFKTHLF